MLCKNDELPTIIELNIQHEKFCKNSDHSLLQYIFALFADLNVIRWDSLKSIYHFRKPNFKNFKLQMFWNVSPWTQAKSEFPEI